MAAPGITETKGDEDGNRPRGMTTRSARMQASRRHTWRAARNCWNSFEAGCSNCAETTGPGGTGQSSCRGRGATARRCCSTCSTRSPTMHPGTAGPPRVPWCRGSRCPPGSLAAATVLAPLLDERLNEEGRASGRVVSLLGKLKASVFGTGVEGTVTVEPGHVNIDEGPHLARALAAASRKRPMVLLLDEAHAMDVTDLGALLNVIQDANAPDSADGVRAVGCWRCCAGTPGLRKLARGAVSFSERFTHLDVGAAGPGGRSGCAARSHGGEGAGLRRGCPQARCRGRPALPLLPATVGGGPVGRGARHCRGCREVGREVGR